MEDKKLNPVILSVKVMCAKGQVAIIDGICSSYNCSCENGIPLDKNTCKMNDEQCASCDVGYELQEDKTCSFTGIIFTMCTSDLSKRH